MTGVRHWKVGYAGAIAVRSLSCHAWRKSCWSSPVMGGTSLPASSNASTAATAVAPESIHTPSMSPCRVSASVTTDLAFAGSPSVNFTSTTSSSLLSKATFAADQRVSRTSTPGEIRSARILPFGFTFSTRKSAATAP